MIYHNIYHVPSSRIDDVCLTVYFYKKKLKIAYKVYHVRLKSIEINYEKDLL